MWEVFNFARPCVFFFIVFVCFYKSLFFTSLSHWIAQCFRSLATEPDVGGSVPPLGLRGEKSRPGWPWASCPVVPGLPRKKTRGNHFRVGSTWKTLETVAQSQNPLKNFEKIMTYNEILDPEINLKPKEELANQGPILSWLPLLQIQSI